MPEPTVAETATRQLARRRRYERAPTASSLVTLTPAKVQMLRFLAECRFLALPQLARLVCPDEREDLSEKRARRHMRGLFDAGLVDVLPVSRLALAAPDAPNDATLLYGSAPNVYVPTARGLALLAEAGIIEKGMLKRPLPSYGPRNSLFLAHELAVRDVRVWLEGTARASDGKQRILEWKDGEDAAIDLDGGRRVKPDAWFVFQVKEPGQHGEKPVVLVGLVEVDRGTERGDRRWSEKIEAYAALIDSSRLQQVTGYVNARVLVFTPDERRRDQLAGFIRESSRAVAARFWLASNEVLDTPAITLPGWRQFGSSSLHLLI